MKIFNKNLIISIYSIREICFDHVSLIGKQFGQVQYYQWRFKTKRYYQFQANIEALSNMINNAQCYGSKNKNASEYYSTSLQQINKALQVSMIEIYDDINQLQADCLTLVVEKLINLINNLYTKLSADQSVKQQNMPIQTVSQPNSLQINSYCYKCKQNIQKKRIEELLLNLQLKQNTKKLIKQNDNKYALKQEQEDDTLQQKVHIRRIQQILNSQTKTIIQNNNHDSITKRYLINQSKNFLDVTSADLGDIMAIARENFKQYSQIGGKNNNKLAQKIIEVVTKMMAKPMKELIHKFLIKKKKEIKSQISNAYIQTDPIDLQGDIERLKKSLQTKQTIILRIRQAKKQCQDSIIKYIDREKQVQIKCMEYKQNVSLLQSQLKQRLKTSQSYKEQIKNLKQINHNLAEKYKVEIKCLQNMISKQKNIIKSLQKRSHKSIKMVSNANIKNSIQSRKSVRSSNGNKNLTTDNMINLLDNQFDKTKNNGEHTKGSRYIKITKKSRQAKISGFFDRNAVNQMLSNIGETQNKINIDHGQSEKQLMIEKVQSSKNLIQMEDILDLPENQHQLNQHQIQNQQPNHVRINQRQLSIENQFSMEINQIKTQKKQLNEQNICMSIFNSVPITKRRDSKSKIGYRVFRPNRITLFREDRSYEDSTYEVNNMRKWMNKVLQQNKQNASHCKYDDSLNKKVKDDKFCRTQGNQVAKDFIPKLQRFNASKITINDLKQKNRKQYSPPHKTQFYQQIGPIKSKNQTIPLLNLNQNHYYLFGGQKSAIQYQKNNGIWPHLQTADKIILDFQNTFFANQIHKFFAQILQQNPQKYTQITNFLTCPIQYTCKLKNNQKYDSESFMGQRINIKDKFNQLIRYHKIIHKNCNHVTQFLNYLGFKGY